MASLDFCKFCGSSISGDYCPHCRSEQRENLCECEGCTNTPARNELICSECWNRSESWNAPGSPEDPNYYEGFYCERCDGDAPVPCTCKREKRYSCAGVEITEEEIADMERRFKEAMEEDPNGLPF